MTDTPTNVVDQIARDEGFRGTLYDDATGEPIVPGSVVKGHPTIGYGFALDVAPLSEAECKLIVANRVDEIRRMIFLRVPVLGWDAWPESNARRAVLINMAYQIGVSGLFEFKEMFAAIERADFAAAADAMLASKWAQRTPERAARLAQQMRTGQWV